MSACRSFGSNLRPSSQSRKMSIGIMIDALEDKRSRATERGRITESNTKRAKSNEVDSVKERTKVKVADASEEKETEAPEMVTSPWIDTRSFHRKTRTSQTTSTLRKVSGRAQGATITHSMQSFSNNLRADGGKQQKIDGISDKRMGSKDGDSQKPEECKLGNSPKKGDADANEDKQTESAQNVTCPGIGNRSFHTTASPTTSAKRNKPGRAQDATIFHFVPSFASHLHADGGKQQDFDEITDKRMGSKVGNSQKPEEFKFVSAYGVLASTKAAKGDEKEGGRTETLKKKLQEIFGAVSSPRSQPAISQGCDVGVNNLKPMQIHHQKGNGGNAVVKPIQLTDTIETDSENPDCAMTRPVTRSLTRMRVATQVRSSKTKTGTSPTLEQKFHAKNIFSFEEGLFDKRYVVSGGFSMSARNKGSRNNSGIKPRKIYFSKNNNANEIQGTHCKNERPLPAEKESSLGDKSISFHGSPQGEEKFQELSNTKLKGDSHRSAGENRVGQQEGSTSPFVPMNEDQHEKFGNQDMKNISVSHDESISPTFKINSPTLSSPPSSTPKSHQIEHRVRSPVAAEEEFTPGNIYSWKNLQTSKADLHASNAKAESSDNADVLEDSPPCKQFPFKGKQETPEGLSDTSSEDGDSKNSEEEFKERGGFSPENPMAKRSNFMGYATKRLCKREGNSISQFSPTLPSPKGPYENNWTFEPSEHTQENELERIIKLFALALENFRNKMKSATKKKSSEILMSVSEEIHLQLQNVQSQIQTDIGNLIRIGKSKRKRLDTRFQEQLDRLNLIYHKLKEDIHHHLQDCKSTVEELEMLHIELKGSMKKQKASHEKVANEVEKTIETLLHDADRRIKAVSKSAKEKMLHLQQIIIECLKESSL